MKRKYYLRGLGIGILITALVFIIAGPSELSEEEIIKRAEELGYTKVEVTPSLGIKDLLETGTPSPTKAPEVTLTMTPAPSETLVETPEPTPTEIPVATTSPTPIPTDIPTPTPTVTPIPTPTLTPTEAPTPTTTPAAEVITAVIVVERGNTATVVCNKIQDAGVLEDGRVLRTYLVNNNLTDYINIGQYTLSSDMSVEEMADILTGR